VAVSVAVRGTRTVRWLLRAGAAGTAFVAVLVVTSNVVVLARTSDEVTGSVDDLEHAQVAIVPGSLVLADGSLGRVVAERLDAAVALYEAGVVDKLLVSGDNGTAAYDEPDAMRVAALAAGVAPSDVFTDYAGFNTWHTMRRARDIFGVSSAVVVTQDTYAARSVDLARAAGIEAQGYVAGSGGRSVREALARARGLGEATLRPRVTGGPAIPITGDGRASWAEETRGS
jgi:SanA protein